MANKMSCMSNAERIIIWPVVVVSLIMSIIAMCRSLPCVVSLDYMGVIVGILSLLVTVLIGWNIYTVVDFNRIKEEQKEAMNEIERLREELPRETKKTMEEMKLDWSTDLISYVPLEIAFNSDKPIEEKLALCFEMYANTKDVRRTMVHAMSREFILKTVESLSEIDGQFVPKMAKSIAPLVKEEYVTYFLSDNASCNPQQYGQYYALMTQLLKELCQRQKSDNPDQ
jgi:hypothetical protein